VRVDLVDDPLISHISPSTNLPGLNPWRRWHVQHLIGHQGHQDLRSIGHPIQNIFDHNWTSIGVNPDFQNNALQISSMTLTD